MTWAKDNQGRWHLAVHMGTDDDGQWMTTSCGLAGLQYSEKQAFPDDMAEPQKAHAGLWCILCLTRDF